MYVTIEFLDEFESVIKGSKITVDPDYNDTIENLKVLITLKYSELDMKRFRLMYRNKILKSNQTLNSLGIKEGEVIQVKKAGGGCCNLF